jgi:serine/threonine protein kinase
LYPKRLYIYIKYLIPCRGYLPPEYVNESIVSEKLDIYSLGVVIIKTIAGCDGHTKSAEMSSEEFINYVRTAISLYQDE